MSELIVGIDLGTTNSAISWFNDDGVPEIILIDGKPTMPSCVGIDPAGSLIVGQRAKNQMVAAPEATVLSIKRDMGTARRVQLGEKEFSPEEISGFILRELKLKAEAHLGRPVGKAVITVPAFFEEHQRRATQNAGELAGLEVVRVVNEPTAAALAYEAGDEADRRLLVYDLGGGTFDVSVVVVEKGVVEVKASRGDTRLGGDDFDEVLMRYVEERFEEEHGQKLGGGLKAKRRLRVALERAKCQLSDEPVVQVREEYVDGERHLDLEIERNVYEELIQGFLDKTLDCVSEALRDAKLLPSDIDKVMLVGGSTRTPAVHRMLTAAMKKEPRFEIDPDLVVGLGAAVQGGLIAGRESKTILVDITPHSLGIEVLRFAGMAPELVVQSLISRNTPLPARKSEMFATSVDNQENVDITVCEGEHTDPEKNTRLGKFSVEGLSKVPQGNPVIVTFDLDLNGMLEVTAREKKTGFSKSVSIDTRSRKTFDLAQARANMSGLIGTLGTPAKDVALLGSGESGAKKEEAGGLHQELVQTMKGLEKRAAAILDTGIDPDDAEELREWLGESKAAESSGKWETLTEVNDKISDLLFYLED